MKYLLSTLSLTVALTAGCTTMAPPENPQGVHGMIAIKSAHNVKTTIDKYEAGVKALGANVVARVDHAAGAQRVGQVLRPTELLIWGSPQSGTAMMLCAQTVGIDLPQKALAWQDVKGDVYLAWNDPVHLITARHETPGCEGVTRQVAATLRTLATQATQ